MIDSSELINAFPIRSCNSNVSDEDELRGVFIAAALHAASLPVSLSREKRLLVSLKTDG